MYYTKEERLARFKRRKAVGNRLSPTQALAILVIVLATPVVISDYFSARQELHQAKAYNTVTSVKR